MKIWLKALIAAAITAFVCIGIIFFLNRTEEKSGRCEIWYITGDISDEALNDLIVSYNSTEGGGVNSLSSRAFDSRKAIDAALAENANSLVICSYDTAERVNDEGGLFRADGLDAAYYDEILKASPSAGKGFYPFGYSAAVLCRDEAFDTVGIEFRHDNLRELMDTFSQYTEKTGRPCASVDSIWSILVGELGEQDFTGMIDVDRSSEKFRDCYNLLAEAIFERSLSCVPGDTLCRIVSSREIKENEEYCPVPGMKSGEGKYVGTITGFALLRNDETAVNFLRYALSDGAMEKLALRSGMDSAMEDSSGRLSISDVVFPEYDREAVRNRNEFNLKSAQTLDYID